MVHSYLCVKEVLHVFRENSPAPERTPSDQAEVAKEVGLSARGYQDLELGAKPGFDNLLHIADFYDVSVDWLMGRTDNPHAHR